MNTLQTERVILATLLAQTMDVTPAIQELTPEDFRGDPMHRRLFAHLRATIRGGQPVVAPVIPETLGLEGEETAKFAALIDPTLCATSADALAQCIRLVRKATRQRDVRFAAGELARNNGASFDGHVLNLNAALAAYAEIQAGVQAGLALGSVSTGDLFAAREKQIEWLCWPLAAVGLSTIIDALPKVGKTRFLLEAIHASRQGRTFLNVATKHMRVVYVSEQSAASLAVQAREVGFDGSERVEELRWITREHWSRFIYTEFLEKLEKQILHDAGYNVLVLDTWHTIARLEDERDASEVNRLGNVTLDVATRQKLALVLGRHDRKSGGEVGVSGRSSIQLSGLVDVILHLIRERADNRRKLETLGRVPSLPSEVLIELDGNEYKNLGRPGERGVAEETALEELLTAEPTVGYRAIERRTGISKSRLKAVAQRIGWSQDDEGKWRKAS